MYLDQEENPAYRILGRVDWEMTTQEAII